MRERRTNKAKRRGATAVETILTVVAIMGCFVYPLSQAMRSTGKRIASDSDRSHSAILEQAR